MTQPRFALMQRRAGKGWGGGGEEKVKGEAVGGGEGSWRQGQCISLAILCSCCNHKTLPTMLAYYACLLCLPTMLAYNACLLCLPTLLAYYACKQHGCCCCLSPCHVGGITRNNNTALSPA